MEIQTRDDSSKQNSSLQGTTIASLSFGTLTLLLLGSLFLPLSQLTVIDFFLLIPGSALITIILGLIALFMAVWKESRRDIRLSLVSLLMGLSPIPVYIVIYNVILVNLH